MQEPAATKARNFRTFLLMEQFAAREIGARLEQARKERGLTQEELAEIAPFSKRSLQDYEAGVTIPYRHLRDLSRLLKKPEEWFLYGEDEAGVDRATADQIREVLERVEGVQGQVADVRELVEALRRDLGLEPPAASQAG